MFPVNPPISPLQSEDIRLEPELYDSCKPDIARLCPNVAYGNAQVVHKCCTTTNITEKSTFPCRLNFKQVVFV